MQQAAIKGPYLGFRNQLLSLGFNLLVWGENESNDISGDADANSNKARNNDCAKHTKRNVNKGEQNEVVNQFPLKSCKNKWLPDDVYFPLKCFF